MNSLSTYSSASRAFSHIIIHLLHQEMAAPRRTQIGQQYDALERAEASVAGAPARWRAAELSFEDSAGEQQVLIPSSIFIIINL